VGGDATTVVRAGQQQIGATPAIEADQGSVTYDPNVTLVANRPAVPPISGTAAVVRTWVPSLAARGAGPGGTVHADLFSPSGDVVLLLTSLVADPLDLPPFGRFWLDPNLFIVAGVGVVGASGHVSHSFPIASDPNLSFGAWSVQALSGTFAGGFRLSNPAAYVLAN
jgi:hypothetical protein